MKYIPTQRNSCQGCSQDFKSCRHENMKYMYIVQQAYGFELRVFLKKDNLTKKSVGSGLQCYILAA